MNTLVESNPNSAVTGHGHGDEHHEKPHYDDVNVPSVVRLGVISGLVTYITIVFVQGLYYQWEASQIEVKEYGTPVAAAKAIAQQKESLTGYLQAKEGSYKKSIPIDQTMLMLVDELQAKDKEKKGAADEKSAFQGSASATITKARLPREATAEVKGVDNPSPEPADARGAEGKTGDRPDEKTAEKFAADADKSE